MVAIEAKEIIQTMYKGKPTEFQIKALKMAYTALDKQIPNKFVYPKNNQEPYRCPSCNGDLGFTDDYFGDLEITHFCRNCGQRLCN